MTRKIHPPGQEQHERCRLNETPTKIIQDLPSRDDADGIGNLVAVEVGYAREQPPHDLPVTTNPTVLSPAVRAEVRWIIVDQFDIRYQGRTRIRSFDQIVTQQSIF